MQGRDVTMQIMEAKELVPCFNPMMQYTSVIVLCHMKSILYIAARLLIEKL